MPKYRLIFCLFYALFSISCVAQNAQLSVDWLPKKELIDIISKHHYLQPDAIELNGFFDNVDSLNEKLQTLDPYSRYLPSEQNAYFKKRRAKYQIGLGINILINDDKLLAVPLQGAPAYQASFKQPRYLHTINGRKISASDFSSFRFLNDLSVDQVVPLQIIENQFVHEIKEYKIKIDFFENSDIEYLHEKGVSIIRIHAFESGLTRQLKQHLLSAIKQKDKIIIDLRYCPGGDLFETVDAISLFLKDNLEVAYLKKAKNNHLRTLSSLSGRVISEQPVYIWVSPFTASSAEIFARILHYYASAQIIGTETTGKCLSQQTFEFEDESALSLSVFEVLTPNKQSCQGKAIQPDVVLDSKDIFNNQLYLDKSVPKPKIGLFHYFKHNFKVLSDFLTTMTTTASTIKFHF